MLTFTNLTLRPGESEEKLRALCERKLRAPAVHFRILKKSLDARDKGDIKWVYSVECSQKKEPHPEREYERIKGDMPRVFVVGTGPAGLFCAVRLIRHGIRPVLIERRGSH